MKKLVASLLGICSMVAYVHAQGTFIVDSTVNTNTSPSATSGGLVFIKTNGTPVIDTSTDISMQIYWGTSASTIVNTLNMDPLNMNTTASTAWLANQGTGSGDITFLGNGTIVDPNGQTYVMPGEAVGTELFLTIQAWTGNSLTYAGVTSTGANAGLTGQTSATTTLVSSTTVPPADISSMGALILTIPEPSILALSGIGAAALMLVRRKK